MGSAGPGSGSAGSRPADLPVRALRGGDALPFSLCGPFYRRISVAVRGGKSRRHARRPRPHGDYQHEERIPIALSCGISQQQIDALAKWRDSKLFDDKQRALLAYADAMVSEKGMDDATFAAMQRYYSTQEIVELTMQAAYYSASSQISRALNITAVGNPEKSGYGTCR